MNLFRAGRQYYRRIVPAAVRDPLGLARRYLMDDLRRLVASPPLPSRTHLRQIQTTPFLEEYLRVGRAAAAAVNRSFARHGVAEGSRVLDFGCGSGRVSRHLARQWDLYGCDVDAAAIRWSNANLPGTFVTNGSRPPLPFPDGHFQAVLSISVFTHLDWDAQRAWAAEMGRILGGGGARDFSPERACTRLLPIAGLE
jgi:SAM-dependent methyltransferase